MRSDKLMQIINNGSAESNERDFFSPSFFLPPPPPTRSGMMGRYLPTLVGRSQGLRSVNRHIDVETAGTN